MCRLTHCGGRPVRREPCADPDPCLCLAIQTTAALDDPSRPRSLARTCAGTSETDHRQSSRISDGTITQKTLARLLRSCALTAKALKTRAMAALTSRSWVVDQANGPQLDVRGRFRPGSAQDRAENGGPSEEPETATSPRSARRSRATGRRAASDPVAEHLPAGGRFPGMPSLAAAARVSGTAKNDVPNSGGGAGLPVRGLPVETWTGDQARPLFGANGTTGRLGPAVRNLSRACRTGHLSTGRIEKKGGAAPFLF